MTLSNSFCLVSGHFDDRVLWITLRGFRDSSSFRMVWSLTQETCHLLMKLRARQATVHILRDWVFLEAIDSRLGLPAVISLRLTHAHKAWHKILCAPCMRLNSVPRTWTTVERNLALQSLATMGMMCLIFVYSDLVALFTLHLLSLS